MIIYPLYVMAFIYFCFNTNASIDLQITDTKFLSFVSASLYAFLFLLKESFSQKNFPWKAPWYKPFLKGFASVFNTYIGKKYHGGNTKESSYVEKLYISNY